LKSAITKPSDLLVWFLPVNAASGRVFFAAKVMFWRSFLLLP